MIIWLKIRNSNNSDPRIYH